MPHIHRTHRTGWLRAAVLGANDGVLSVAGLVIGVAAAHSNEATVLVAGIAAIVAGALSMAAGEYVSVSSQADTERADLEIERVSLEHNFEAERAELEGIYVKRGLDPKLAQAVATQLMAKDALGAHARDEIGISEALTARPLQAAFSSAASFTVGGTVPLAAMLIAPFTLVLPWVAGVSLVFLAFLGGLAARAGGAPVVNGAVRVVLWGGLVMSGTTLVGTLAEGLPRLFH